MDFDDVLLGLEQLLEGEGTAKNKEQLVAKLIGQMYDGCVKKYRPLIRAIPLVSGRLSKDLTPLIVSLLKFANTVRENKELQKEIQRSKNITAKQRFEALKAYEKAGFSHDEAMALVLQDAASPSSTLANLAKFGSAVPTKKSS